MCEAKRGNYIGSNNPMFGRKPWNAGLTKDTSAMLAKIGRKNAIHLAGRQKVTREIRSCECGCGKEFECKANSAQKYLFRHSGRKGLPKKRIKPMPKQSLETCLKKSAAFKKIWRDRSIEEKKELARKIGDANRGKTGWSAGLTKENNVSLEKLSKSIKKYHDSLPTEERDRQLAKRLSAACQRPNKFEFNCMSKLKELYGNNFKYTGDGSMVVNHRSADAYSEGLKTVALFHGIYWHLKKLGLDVTEENKRLVEQADSMAFSSAGYKVIFIWEDNVDNVVEVDKVGD